MYGVGYRPMDRGMGVDVLDSRMVHEDGSLTKLWRKVRRNVQV
jgi:hypothetical protein